MTRATLWHSPSLEIPPSRAFQVIDLEVKSAMTTLNSVGILLMQKFGIPDQLLWQMPGLEYVRTNGDVLRKPANDLNEPVGEIGS